jgi:hypothetical protein
VGIIAIKEGRGRRNSTFSELKKGTKQVTFL